MSDPRNDTVWFIRLYREAGTHQEHFELSSAALPEMTEVTGEEALAGGLTALFAHAHVTGVDFAKVCEWIGRATSETYLRDPATRGEIADKLFSLAPTSPKH